jgi:hypothetical protein
LEVSETGRILHPMSTFGIIYIEYLGSTNWDLENISTLFHVQGFGICHFFRMEQRIKILVHFSGPTCGSSFTHLLPPWLITVISFCLSVKIGNTSFLTTLYLNFTNKTRFFCYCDSNMCVIIASSIPEQQKPKYPLWVILLFWSNYSSYQNQRQ